MKRRTFDSHSHSHSHCLLLPLLLFDLLKMDVVSLSLNEVNKQTFYLLQFCFHSSPSPSPPPSLSLSLSLLGLLFLPFLSCSLSSPPLLSEYSFHTKKMLAYFRLFSKGIMFPYLSSIRFYRLPLHPFLSHFVAHANSLSTQQQK